MEHLWAPWRVEYITRAGRTPGCIFCDAVRRAVRGHDPESHDRLGPCPCGTDDLVVHQDRRLLVMLNRYPYNNGHLMIAPRRHIAQLEKLTPTELRQMMALLTKCLRILRLSLRPDGFNVGMNLGRVAGAGVEHHLHLHIVPRWNGDTNFMPVLGQTRVVSEHLQVTAARLRMAFRGPGTRQIRVMPRRAVRTRQRK